MAARNRRATAGPKGCAVTGRSTGTRTGIAPVDSYARPHMSRLILLALACWVAVVARAQSGLNLDDYVRAVSPLPPKELAVLKETRKTEHDRVVREFPDRESRRAGVPKGQTCFDGPTL